VIAADAVRIIVENPLPLPVAETVMLALPWATPVTTPVVALTLATVGALLAYARVTVTPAPAGTAFALNRSSSPIMSAPPDGKIVTPVSAAGNALTTTVAFAVSDVVEKPAPLPTAVTAMTAVPGETPATSPVAAFTVATPTALLEYV